MVNNFKFTHETLCQFYPYRHYLLIISPFIVVLAGSAWLGGGFFIGQAGGMPLVFVWMIICWLGLASGCICLRLGCVTTFCFDPNSPNDDLVTLQINGRTTRSFSLNAHSHGFDAPSHNRRSNSFNPDVENRENLRREASLRETRVPSPPEITILTDLPPEYNEAISESLPTYTDALKMGTIV